MEKIPLGILLTDLIINLRVAEDREDDIVGFAELNFHEGENVVIKVRGVVLKIKLFPNESEYKFSVNFPAYPSAGKKFNTSFIVENKSLYTLICNAVIKEFTNTLTKKGIDASLSPEKILKSIRFEIPDSI